MRKNRLSKLLSYIVNLKPGEEKLVVLLFICFFLIGSPHTIIKALRYTDLLTKIGTGGLPIAYLLTAIITGLVVLFHSRTQFKISGQLLITRSLIFFIITGIILDLLLSTKYGRESFSLSYFFWVWASILTIVLVTQFWSIINEVFNLREAKRLIGFCGSGGILGGIVGGLLAKSLTQANLANLLLPIACSMLFACIFVVRAIFAIRQKKLSSAPSSAPKTEPPDLPKVGFMDTFIAIRKNNYLVLISGLVVITVIVSTLIDFQFSSAVNEHFKFDYVDPKASMQAFFGLFYAGLLTFSFLLSLFLTSRILRNFRLRIPVLLTPVTLFLCSLGILFMPFTITLAVVIKGGEEGLGFSLHQPVREILYIPIASDLKVKVKLFIDMFISRFAKVLAAGFLLLFALTRGKEIDYLTPSYDVALSKDLIYGVIAFLIIWIIIGLIVGKEHNRVIKEGIEIVWPDAYQEVKKVDVDLAKLIIDTIESKNRSSVLYALHLFDLIERDKLTPEIKKAISQKSEEATASSLGELFETEGATWILETGDDVSLDSLIADIRDIVSSDAYQQAMRLYTDWVAEEGEKSDIEKMEMAKTIGLMKPDAPMVEKLEALISDDSPEVSNYAMRSAARLKKVEHIPAIMHKLGNPKTHEDAVRALEAYGHLAMSNLEECLRDSEKDIQLRKAVIEVLAGIGSRKAVKLLLSELDRKPEELETEIIDALDHIRSENAEIHFPTEQVKRVIISIIKKYCRTFIDLQKLGLDKNNEERAHRMERDLETNLRSIFDLIGLYYPHDDIVKAYQNIIKGTKDSVADATELLDITLKRKMKKIILPLIEDLNPSERQQKFQQILRNLDSL